MKIIDKFIECCSKFEDDMSAAIIQNIAPAGKFYDVIKPTTEFMIRDDMVSLRMYFSHRAVYEFIKTLDSKNKKLMSSVSSIAERQMNVYDKMLRPYLFNNSLTEKKQTLNFYFNEMKDIWFALLKKKFM